VCARADNSQQIGGTQRGRFLGHQAGIAVGSDLVWVVLFAAYLLTARLPASVDLTAGKTIGGLRRPGIVEGRRVALSSLAVGPSLIAGD
jgi:hypothetical protein